MAPRTHCCVCNVISRAFDDDSGGGGNAEATDFLSTVDEFLMVASAIQNI